MTILTPGNRPRNVFCYYETLFNGVRYINSGSKEAVLEGDSRMTGGAMNESNPLHSEAPKRASGFGAGWILIAIGCLLLLENLFHWRGEIFLIVLGGAFLAGHLSNRSYGLLVPAMILIGLGAGITASETRLLDLEEYWIPLFMGIGFVAIYLIDRFTWQQSTSWPIWPGGILVLIALWGIAYETGFFIDIWWDFMDIVSVWWPVLLILWGFLLLRRRHQSEESSLPGGHEPEEL